MTHVGKLTGWSGVKLQLQLNDDDNDVDGDGVMFCEQTE